MSGGEFDYIQFRLGDVASYIAEMIHTENGYDDEIIKEFRNAVYFIRKAEIYIHRVDWLVCCDDGPESFKRRLAEQLGELEQNSAPTGNNPTANNH